MRDLPTIVRLGVRTAGSSCHPASSSQVSSLGRGPSRRQRATPYAAPPATATADQPLRLPASDSVPALLASAARASRHLCDLWVMSDVDSLPRTATSPQHRPGSAKTSAAVSTRLTRSDPTRRDPIYRSVYTTVGDRQDPSRAEVAHAPATARDTPLVVRRPAGRRPRVETRLHIDGGAGGVDHPPAGGHWRLVSGL
jgi:hypothetical protein